MNPTQAKQLNRKKLTLNIIKVADLLIEFMDEILITEIDSLTNGGFQDFSMKVFASARLQNDDNNFFVNNTDAIIAYIVHKYNGDGWEARRLPDTDVVMQIKIAKKYIL
jgi:hypothetical protein